MSTCDYCVDFAVIYDEVIVIFMVNCCDNYGESSSLFLLSCSVIIISTLLAVNHLIDFLLVLFRRFACEVLMLCIFLEDVSGPQQCHHCFVFALNMDWCYHSH